jgi:hypothetical protein
MGSPAAGGRDHKRQRQAPRNVRQADGIGRRQPLPLAGTGTAWPYVRPYIDGRGSGAADVLPFPIGGAGRGRARQRPAADQADGTGTA